MSKLKAEHWHKKKGKSASVSSTARHASIKDGRPSPNPVSRLNGAQVFLQKLMAEIRRSV